MIPEYVRLPGFQDTATARHKLDETFDRRFGHGYTPGLWDADTEMMHVLQERPDAKRVTLSPDFKGSNAESLSQHARADGYDLVEIDLYERAAYYARLTPAARAIRKRLSAFLKCEPWALEVAVEVDEAMNVLLVQLLRAPEVGTDPEKRLTIWRAAVQVIPGGHPDWRVEEDLVSGRILLEHRPPMALANRVDLLDILPIQVNPDNWATPQFGVDAFGNRTSINLRRAPHLLVVGATGSGKTVFINAQIAARLLAGHEVAVIETEKKFADFNSLIPLLSAHTRWNPDDPKVTKYAKAVAIFEYLSAEADRRSRIFQEHEVQAMWELPADVREREGIRPITIVLDEADGAFEPEEAPALDKTDPRVVEAAEINEQKALLNYYSAYFAKTYRSVGFALIIGLQRADVAALGGANEKRGGRFRANLPGGVFLATPGSEPDAEGLRMVFKSAASDAAETRRRLDSGFQGLALSTVDDVPGITALRVGYAPVKTIVTALRERGVQDADEWKLANRTPREDIALPDAFDDFDAGFDDDPWCESATSSVVTGGGGGFAPSLDDLFA